MTDPDVPEGGNGWSVSLLEDELSGGSSDFDMVESLENSFGSSGVEVLEK